MNFLVDSVLGLCDSIPGMACRTRARDGRLKNPLRMTLALVGTASTIGGGALMLWAARGFYDGNLGVVVTAFAGILAVAILAGGAGCIRRSVRNPAPAALPDNVIPIARARTAARTEGTSGSRMLP